MAEQVDIQSSLLNVAELLPPQEQVRPVRGISDYVCERLRYDIARIETGELSIDAFKAEIVEPMIQGLTSDEIGILVEHANLRDRRVALLDLFLIQEVLNNKRGIKDSVYSAKQEPETSLEKIRKQLADIDGFDWHLMPWTLTAKDYPVQDIRRMFIDDGAADSEKLLLEMQYLLEQNFFHAVGGLMEVLEIVRGGNGGNILPQQMSRAIAFLEQNIQFMSTLNRAMPAGYFEKYITQYYPSGAYAVGVYIIEAMLRGRTQPLMRRIEDASTTQRSRIDPDILMYLDYVRNPSNTLFSDFDLDQYTGLHDQLDQVASRISMFRNRHAGAATTHTEGGRLELETRAPVLGNDKTVNTMESLLGQ